MLGTTVFVLIIGTMPLWLTAIIHALEPNENFNNFYCPWCAIFRGHPKGKKTKWGKTVSKEAGY